MLSHFFKRPRPHSAEKPLQALQSPSGYERERALRQLAVLQQPPDMDTLRAVLLRMNDWVPQVRAAAEGVLQAWWPQLSPTAMLACMDQLEALSRGQRADQRWLKRLRDRLVAADDPGAFARLQALVLGRTQAVFAWQLLRQRGALPEADLPEADLLQLGLRSENAWVASQAARALSRCCPLHGYEAADQEKLAVGATYHPYLRLLEQALAHRQSSVRAQAMRSVPDGWRSWPRPEADALERLLRAALFDRNASVRYLAVLRLGETPAALSRWVLAQLAQLAQPSDLAGQRASPSFTAGALQLLADLGQPESHGAVMATLTAPVPSVRRVAFQAALRMGLLSPAQALARALADAAPSVFASSWRWCKRSRMWPSRAELQELGVLDADWRAVTPDPRVQSVLATLDPWEDLLALLRLPNPESAQGEHWHVGQAGAADAWLQAANRRVLAPTARQLGEVKALLASGQTGAFSQSLGTLRFVLQGL